MSNVLGALQRVGKALMLPVAVLPLAALLLRLGAGDIFDIPFIMKAGEAIFANLALIFAIAVAVGLAKDDAGAAGLAGAVGYLIFTAAIGTIDKDINMGVLSGILMGVCAGALYNRFHTIKLPDYLAFFGGKRFVPIITGITAIALAYLFGLIWPPMQEGLNTTGNWMVESGPIGAFIYGTLNRLLIPTGLHHILNTFVWFVFGSFTNAEGVAFTGDLHRFFAGDPSAGIYMAGFFPMMMFGLPAACLAMLTTAKSENKKKAAGILAGVAFVSFLTGITEPVEFLFMFLAPMLYLIHALLTGLSLAVCVALGIKHGFGFSAGLLDFGLNWGLATKPWMLLVMGAVLFAIYYLVFVFFIKAFNLKTPGREDDDDDDIAASGEKSEKVGTLARQYLKALGGHSNLTMIDSCITRLRLSIKDRNIISDDVLKALGAKGVVNMGKNGIQVVLGMEAEAIAKGMKQVEKSDSLSDVPLPEIKKAAKKAALKKETDEVIESAIQIMAPISGEIVPIEDVPDKVFSDKMAGDGIAINPDDDCLAAPCDGIIGKIFETNHAFSMQTTDGIELFVHFGLDTVKLKGKGFKRIAKEGQTVKAGDKIISFDLDQLKKSAKNIITPIVISNMEIVKTLKKSKGKVSRGKDVILTVKL